MRPFLIWIVLSAAAVAIVGFANKSGYPYVLASAEARASLEVTAQQLAELKSARYASDAIAFGIVGGMLAAVCVLVELLTQAPRLNWARNIVIVPLSVFIGFAAGAAGGWLGNLFEDLNSRQLDATTRLWLRWTIVLLPAAVVSGLLVALAASLFRRAADFLIFSVLGVVVSILAITVLHGTVTTFEARPPVFPDMPDNRFWFPTLFLILTSLLVTFQITKPRASESPQNRDEQPTN